MGGLPNVGSDMVNVRVLVDNSMWTRTYPKLDEACEPIAAVAILMSYCRRA